MDNYKTYTTEEVEFVSVMADWAIESNHKQLEKLHTRLFNDNKPAFKATWQYYSADLHVAMLNASQDDPLAIGLAEMIERGYVQNTITKQKVHLFASACGTGKTTAMPFVWAKHFGYERILLLVPRIMAARNAYSEYAKKGRKVYCRAGGETMSNCVIRKCELGIVSMGSLPGVLRTNAMGDLSKTLIIYDECHDVSSETIVAWALITTKLKTDIVCTSATPQHFGFPSLKNMKTTNWFIAEPIDDKAMKAKGKYWSNKMRSQRLLDLSMILKDLPLSGQNCAIVGASLKVADHIAQNFPYKFAYEVSVSASGMSFRKAGGIVEKKVTKADTKTLAEWVDGLDNILYLCTPVVEVGVTLPNLDFVIDCGSRYRIQIDRQAITMDTYPRASISKSSVEPATYAEITQVMGRVSRVRPGTSLVFNAENLVGSTMSWSDMVIGNGRLVEAGLPRCFDVPEPTPGKGFIANAKEFIRQNNGKYDENTLQEVKTAERAIETAEALILLGKVPKGQRVLPLTDVLRKFKEGHKAFPFSTTEVTPESAQTNQAVFLGLTYESVKKRKEKFETIKAPKKVTFVEPSVSLPISQTTWDTTEEGLPDLNFDVEQQEIAHDINEAQALLVQAEVDEQENDSVTSAFLTADGELEEEINVDEGYVRPSIETEFFLEKLRKTQIDVTPQGLPPLEASEAASERSEFEAHLITRRRHPVIAFADRTISLFVKCLAKILKVILRPFR
ncbi:hypothetical protein [Rhizoctonia solani fusarivirus 1]|uniref:Helicase ATP-binding domain-containing protein n=1 Tax=Rhizoctonia solani fusarivirus 1 TaxID=2599953 RepID=A0AAE6HX72_9VIRU|nr:hypothetical protein QKQ63_gp1 [Rhizoctonia solani fusarivirus 1]QDW92693.1 hypothetical protein [Rhizoctonia solani fusarivirus 1]